MGMLDEYGGAVSFLQSLDEKGIARYVHVETTWNEDEDETVLRIYVFYEVRVFGSSDRCSPHTFPRARATMSRTNTTL